jgi:hypothetical protein
MTLISSARTKVERRMVDTGPEKGAYFGATLAERYSDRAAFVLIEKLGPGGGQAGEEGGFFALAEGIARGEDDDARLHGGEEFVAGEEVLFVASENENIGTQAPGVVAHERILRGSTAVGHKQDAEGAVVDARHDALVIGRPCLIGWAGAQDFH